MFPFFPPFEIEHVAWAENKKDIEIERDKNKTIYTLLVSKYYCLSYYFSHYKASK